MNGAAGGSAVQAWSERVVIPTYTVGTPDRNPMFLEKRVYQGSSGAVYPHPVIDRIEGRRVERAYTAVFLENEYLRIMVLPELGGRVQMAVDKTNGYHFVYHNRVIKPALVGLCGPWISGGIEFNWPQHHRPSTFEPLDWAIEAGPDGARTVWCSEVERMSRTQGRHGFRLHPGRAYLEVEVHLVNRTDEPRSFLWWANPAVHVHDQYQSVFPPDVRAVMDHGKRAVSDFPIATGTYYHVNYAPGTDISRYDTIPVPTSYMAHHSDFDFLGCYDHRARAGLLHVADHRVVPGKKQWTWGNGPFGHAWDRQLTDADGPYIELMCGAFTDNQPDFTWIMPGEEKTFTQVFLPYKEIGPPRNAGRDAAASLHVRDGVARIGVYASSRRTLAIRLRRGEETLCEVSAELAPERAFLTSVALPPGTDPGELTLRVHDGEEELVAIEPPSGEPAPAPRPATAARPPAEIASVEELFLNGLHLEQYRHATYSPLDYYLEALRRDPGDSRCLTAVARIRIGQGKFAEAEPHLRAAIGRLTLRNPNPYDGEPSYQLGRCLLYQGRLDEAYDAFAKAGWTDAWKGPAAFAMARLAARRGDLARALGHLDEAEARGSHVGQARHLKAAILRRLGRTEEARREARRGLRSDPLELGAVRESGPDSAPGDGVFRTFCGLPTRAIELALDCAHAGLFDEAIDLLDAGARGDLMAAYFAAWFRTLAGDDDAARAILGSIASASPGYFFPNELECVPALESALRLDPEDWKAAYGLGNFWYGHRRHEEAIAAWERCAAIRPDFPTAHRNLGLALVNARKDDARGLAEYETAFALGPDDARVFFELDQLRKRTNEGPASRLARLEARPDLVAFRDDLTIERVTLLNALGRHDEALSDLLGRTFHPWEGGEGKPAGQYVQALIGRARAQLAAGRPDEAVASLLRAREYPENLGEGKLPGARENHVLYWLGRAHAEAGNEAEAASAFEAASEGQVEPAEALYYNDQPPEMILYQGLALRALGRGEEAERRFEALAQFGRDHLGQNVAIDYFAVSLPDFLVFEDDLRRRNDTHCHYLMGLGRLGQGRRDEALAAFDLALALDASHFGALIHQPMATTTEARP
ncbi:DUF5107 domain-containing protein [Aquisphaera insulae]|uniref:DUF5107 domain-containing protein n=1 Tax=Aquisphaera insulae TaxID=2712864 RepID=UPI0013EC4FBF|nr:DUF5107 domain-containing protein [Aquisphaera insulae]